MMFWFGLTQAHTDTCIHTHTDSLFPHSLFIIMLTLLVLHGRRQRSSLLFHEGRLISAKSVCAPLLIPHHSRIVWLPGISEISHQPNLLEMWEICEQSPPPPGGSLTRAAGSSAGRAEQRWRRRQREEGFTLFRAPEGYRAKAALILGEKCLAKLGFVARLLCVTGGGLKKKQYLTISLKEACVSP